MIVTTREKDILLFLQKGYTQKEAAKALNISTSTVSMFVSKLLSKSECSTVAQMMYEIGAGELLLEDAPKPILTEGNLSVLRAFSKVEYDVKACAQRLGIRTQTVYNNIKDIRERLQMDNILDCIKFAENKGLL